MQEFLRAVLAGQGHYCITGLKQGVKNPAIQSFFVRLEDTKKAIDTFLEEGRDVYFALATFKDPDHPKPREAKNAQAMRSLWVDIDCGPDKAESGKGYATKEDGFTALFAFIEGTLPEPIIVDSGGGLHCYWPFTKDLTPEEWASMAEGLRELAQKKGLIIDAGCTTDAARILRVPGTFNFKQEEPRPVEVLNFRDDICYDPDALAKLLPKVAPKLLPTKREPSALTKSLMGNRTSLFKKIMQRSKKGDGCAQLWRIYNEQDTVDYDSWRAGLSVANCCDDRDDAIHKISRGHPDYDPGETERKADDTSAPFLCETFEKYYPAGCENCPHKGKIRSPIVLGADVIRSEETEIKEVVEKEGEAVEVIYEIPDLPDPYFRGKTGGIYRQDKDGNPQTVHPHDLFVIQRIDDEEHGESAWMRLHLPHDGIKNFTVPLALLSGPDTMRSELSKRGVVSFDWKNIQAYVISAVRELQVKKKAELAHHQFGWTKRDTFVVGDVELEQGKRRYVPPTPTTSDMVGWYHQKGSLEEWKRVFNTYGTEGMENRAFAALTAFGAPLLKIATNHKGILLNLIHKDSGSGKSTILRMINSVWGHPSDPMRAVHDTKNSLVLRMSVLNNIPLTVDEVTNQKGEDASDFLYGITQGRGKDRMNASSNTLRVNKQTWQTIGVCTSNASMYDKLMSIKDLPKGEMFRCVEYGVPPTDLISTQEGLVLFDEVLMENYGHAWIPYLTAIQTNKQVAIDKVREYTDMINAQMNLSSAYRFYSALGGVNLAGAYIAKELGLLPKFNLGRIYDFYTDTIAEIRETTLDKSMDAVTFISHYVMKYMAQNTLIIDDAVDARTGIVTQQSPRGELLIRMEPDTKRIFLTVKHVRHEAAEGGTHYKELLKELSDNGYLLKVSKKGMSKGTQLATPPVDALWLDAEKMGIEIPTKPFVQDVV